MSGPGHEERDQLWSEATLWFARMRSPDAENFRPEFEQWLARGALHRRYYNRAAEYWVDSGTALAEAGPDPGAQTRQEARPEHGRRRGAVAALIASSVLVAGSTILLIAHDRGAQREAAPPAAETRAPTGISQFATAAGEQRRMRLADGSVVMLGGGTILRIELGRAMRRLELDRGKARFEVAHEPRPFVVFAGGGSITAHGTVFDVGLGSNRRVSVRLIRGSVDVRFPQAAKPGVRPLPRRLLPGETVSYEATVAQASGQPAASPAPARAPAPADSARDYRNVRLADIVSEANRHAEVPIRFADPETGAETVSGRFRTDDTALLAERLAILFDLAVDRSNPHEILLRPK